MNTSRFTKILAAATLALGAAGIAQAAHAGTDVYFSVGVPGAAYYDPQPVYVAPPAVYAQPAQVYVRPGDDGWRWRHQQWEREQMRREEWRREQWRHEQWRRWHRMHREGWDD